MIQKPNLLPPAFLPPPAVNWLRMGLIALILTAVFAVGISGAKFYLDIKGQEEEILNLSSALSNLSPTQERIKDVLKMQQEVERLTAQSGQKQTKEIAWSAILSDLARVMPSALNFERVTAETATLTIKGTAQNPLDVANYVIELRKFHWFSEVEIKEIQFEESEATRPYSFEITASLSREGGQDSAQESVQSKPSA